mgnify:CR=1 FL=1
MKAPQFASLALMGSWLADATEAACPLRVLLVDSDRTSLAFVEDLLDRAPSRYNLSWTDDPEDALAVLRYADVPICLVDAKLPGAIDILRRARRSGYRGVSLMLSEQDDATADLAAMHAGAHAFLLKDELNPLQLERSIRYALSLQRRMVALQEMARRDPLTGNSR